MACSINICSCRLLIFANVTAGAFKQFVGRSVGVVNNTVRNKIRFLQVLDLKFLFLILHAM